MIPVVAAIDSRRFHALRAPVSKALAACRPSSRHWLPGAAATPLCAKTAPLQPGRRRRFPLDAGHRRRQADTHVERGSSWSPVQPEGIDGDSNAEPGDDHNHGASPAANMPGAPGIRAETSMGSLAASLLVPATFLITSAIRIANRTTLHGKDGPNQRRPPLTRPVPKLSLRGASTCRSSRMPKEMVAKRHRKARPGPVSPPPAIAIIFAM